MASSLANRVLGYGLWSVWIANTLRDGYQEAKERGMNPPEDMGEYPIILAFAMSKFANHEARSTGVQVKLGVVRDRVEQCRHRDRFGAEISCETNAFYHGREGYGLIGHWENDSGNTIVHTSWTGDYAKPFQTHIHSTVPRWNNLHREYESQEEAEAGHVASCEFVRKNI